jgi:hypothetical protein
MPDRHTKGYYDKRKKPEWEFIAVDGEGSTDEKGNSIYQLLAAYDNRNGERSIENLDGLATIDCLEFLLNLAYRKEKVCICGYGFTYDVNNILKDLPWKKLKHLAGDNAVGIYIDKTHRYKVRVIYKKALEIWKMERRGHHWVTLKYARIYDVIGFFQTSFLRAIEEWKIGTPEELAIVEQYKLRRGEDLEDDWEGWKRYNATECRLLVTMMEAFNEVLKGVDIRLSNWWGAGAIAAFWFKQHHIKQHLVQSFGETIDKDIMCAFFGGQIQRFQVGIFPGTVYHYDICSAYPAAQELLPALKDGTWRDTDHFEPEQQWALYEVDWDWSSVWPKTMVGLLPHRTKHGSILYPRQGCGVFWYWEVAAVLRHFPQCLKIVRGRIFEPASDVRPFAWIREKFQQRNALKKAKDPRNVPLKLGLNSLYGKTAQKQGMKDSTGRRLLPPYQSYFWAGNITAMTRAKIIDAIASDPTAIIASATDGIFSTRPLNIPLGNDLGDWMEEPTLTGFELYANGVYRGIESTGKELKKARGVEEREFDFKAFQERFKATPDDEKRTMSFKYHLKRFYGYKLAAHRNKPELFNTWGWEERTFYIVGMDCFNVHRTETKNVYRLECYLGQGARRVKLPRRRIQPYEPKLEWEEEELALAEQPD